jgi:hypothetical protein
VSKIIDRNVVLSQRILNFLQAIYLGEDGAIMVMEDLSSPEVTPEMKARVVEVREQVMAWYDRCMKGESLFSVSWSVPETFDSQKAIGYLDQISRRITLAIDDLAQFPREPGVKVPWEQARKVLAGIMRALAFDFYYCVRQRDYYQLTDDASGMGVLAAVEEEFKSRLLWCKRQMDAMQSARKATPAIEAFNAFGEYAECSLRAQMHELSAIKVRFGGPRASLNALYSAEELSLWNSFGFDAQDAGPWRAFKFDPEGARKWTDAGFGGPGDAWAWKVFGFVSSEAKEWAELKISPKQAIAWRDAGLGPNDTRAFMKRGILSPDQLPRGE